MNLIRNFQIISSPGVGGREIDVPVLAKKLLELGHPTWVGCRKDTLVDELSRRWQLPILHTHMQGYFDPADIFSLAGFLRREKIQIIHAHWSKDLFNIILAAKFAGNIPVVLTKHVYSTETKRDVFHDWIYRRVAKVIAISTIVAQNILQTTATPSDRVETVYNGIDLETYWNPALADAAAFKTALGIPAREFCLGFVGRLNQGKGAHFVLDSFLASADKLPGWHLAFVGKAVGSSEENYLARLRAVCDASPHRKRIHFPGYQTRMPEVMAGIDILANASEFESLGMVVVEAMAMAKPALGPAAGGIPEIIEHERTGFLYRPNDRNDFTLAFQKLAKDAMLREKMGKHGRRVTLCKFNLTLMAGHIADLFGRVLNAPHTSSSA